MRSVRRLFAIGVAALAACTNSPGLPAAGDAGGPADGPDASANATADAASPDASSPFAKDGAVDLVPDGGNSTDGSLPYGWVKPRCGGELVDTCADCPSLPLACDTCTLSARCVATCGDCPATAACAASSTCNDSQTPCSSKPFCGCPPAQKECRGASEVTCVSSCGTECAGKPTNASGVCSTKVSWSCPDPGGAEYLCSPTLSCAASCEACGAGICISESCAGNSCDEGFVPGDSFYKCDRKWCCSSGVWCPATSACVSDCTQCGGAGQYQGTCGERGVCVADCATCFAGQPGPLDVQVCAGVCRDRNSDPTNCGACGHSCLVGSVAGVCSQGHCCAKGGTAPPPYTWCQDCNCCMGGASSCSLASCTTDCL